MVNTKKSHKQAIPPADISMSARDRIGQDQSSNPNPSQNQNQNRSEDNEVIDMNEIECTGRKGESEDGGVGLRRGREREKGDKGGKGMRALTGGLLGLCAVLVIVFVVQVKVIRGIEEEIEGLKRGDNQGLIRTKEFTNQNDIEIEEQTPKRPQMNLARQIEQQLHYQQFQYSSNKIIQEKSTNLQIGEQYENNRYAEEQELNVEDYHERLAIKLAEFESDNGADFQDWKILEFEYLKADKSYDFDKVKKELPFCVLVENDEAIKDRKKILESLGNQNYSNFHIVWIEEPEEEQKTLQWPEGRAKDRLKIVRNKQLQGTTANLYFWGRKFCNQDDIIFLLGKGTILLGRQSLKILNAVYQSPDVTFTRSSLLLKRSQYDLVSSQIREQQETLSLIDRKYSKKQGIIQSFRKSLLDSVPIENLMQSPYTNSSKISNTFYQTDPTSFPLYLNLQHPNPKTHTLPQFLTLSLTPQYICENAHQSYIEEKNKFKNSNARGFVSMIATEEGDQHTDWAGVVQGRGRLAKCLERFRGKLRHYLENPVRVVYGDRIFKRTIYNEKAVNKSFTKDPKYTINLTQFLPKVTNDWRSFFSKQVKSQKDEYYILVSREFQTIVRSNKIDFQAMKLSIENEIPFEILEFEPDPTLNMSPPTLTFQALKTPQQAQQYLSSRLRTLNAGTPDKNDVAYQLAYRMQLYPQEREVIEGEYYFVDKKYGGAISRQKREEELPIFIISAMYKIRNRKNGTGDGFLYETYFEHLQTLNYTNYRVVYIDDASPDDSGNFIYQYVKNSKMKIKNRMKIVRTLKNMGVTTNLIFWPQKMCGPDQIVVYVDADDNILGRQSLRVFNHLYRDENTWYAFSRHLKYMRNWWRIRGRSFGEGNIYVRWTVEWAVSNTRTFRSNLMRAVPFYQVIEYHYSPKNLTAWPVFQDLSADGIQVSAHVELAGNRRIAYYDGFTYGYSGTSGSNICYQKIQTYDWRKMMTRSRLQVLDRLDGIEKGKLTEGQPYQEKYHKEAKELTKVLLKKKCFIG